MKKINLRSPFYLFTGQPETTPPIAPQTIPLSCGDTHNIATDVGVVTYQFDTLETGNVDIDISGNDTPIKFTANWDGNSITTGYIGLDSFDTELLAAGVPAGEINTANPSNKNTTLTINKTASNPSLVEVVVDAPLVNDAYSITVNCPTSPPVVIEQTTQINIWFDSSGSMNSTLSPLQSMVANNLKSCLVQFYNNDGAEYDKFVQVKSWADERTFNVAGYEPDVLGATNVINLVFQDEAQPVYHPNTFVFNPNATPTGTYTTDITNLRNKLSSNPTGYITPIIFQVEGFDAFKSMMETVENSLGAYSGNLGLFDYPNVKFYYNLQDGVSYSSNPNYYRDYIIQAFNDLGFSITCP
jgi:hypothetical protein